VKGLQSCSIYKQFICRTGLQAFHKRKRQGDGLQILLQVCMQLADCEIYIS